jgi:nucleoside 2-deoxyribosyltransferase
MKIYFAGSIRGGRENQEWYAQIINELKKFGVVITEHIGSPSLDHLGERGVTELEIYRRDMAWLSEADVLVAEITTPSLGVGYEVAKAESLHKPILCFYHSQPDKKPPYFVGNGYLNVTEYADIHDIRMAIEKFMRVTVAV